MKNGAEGISDEAVTKGGKAGGIPDADIPDRDPKKDHKKRSGINTPGNAEKAIHKEY